MIKTLEEYISSIKECYKSENCCGFEKVYYRGQSNIEYELIPAIGRKIEGYSDNSENYIPFEKRIIETCKLEYPNLFKDNNSIDELALMQHFGMPTRLLDVTENPLVALYFACKGNENNDGEVFVFNSGINAANYTSYNEDSMKRNNKISFVRAKKFSGRQMAQQGLFMWFPDSKVHEMNKNSKIISKIVTIPASDKNSLLSELKMIGISERSLFPENMDKCCKELLGDIIKGAYSC